MLYFIAVRALRRIYRRTVLGWLWLFIIPLLPLALRAVVFGGLLNVPSDGVPYLLFLAAGTVVWDLFALGLTWGARGLEMHRDVTDQVYVPSAILPLGNLAPALLDVAVKFAALLAIALAVTALTGRVYIGVDRAGWTLAALLLAFVLAAGLSLVMSPFGEGGRDLRFALAQILPVWFLLTPVVYPLSAVPPHWLPWMRLNPMAPVAETFRWSLFGTGTHDPRAFGTAALVVVAVFVLSLAYYARAEAATQDSR
jgi:lipopolysaccharide transport system permease protein